jgi:hypothetical protein
MVVLSVPGSSVPVGPPRLRRRHPAAEKSGYPPNGVLTRMDPLGIVRVLTNDNDV